MAKKKDCLLNIGQEEEMAMNRQNHTTGALSASESSSALLIRSTSDGAASLSKHFQVDADAANNNKVTKGDTSISLGYEDTFADQQSRSASPKCPWRGLTMAVVLLLFGTLLIMGGIALISGALHFKSLDNVTPYLILVFGALCIIPGAYHILVACCALRGHERFSFDDIPYFS